MKRLAVRLLLLLAVLLAALAWAWFEMIRMPGDSFAGELQRLSPIESETAQRLAEDVEYLASEPRTFANPKRMAAVADWIASELEEAGLEVERQRFTAAGRELSNVIGVRTGRTQRAIVLGAHYDSVFGCPGADDNASGVAALLALARATPAEGLDCTVRFVAFANEEPPFFQGEGMGSWVYAKRCRDREENLVAMLSLETLGYYSDRPGSQQYPSVLRWFYPETGDFVAFVGHRASRDLVRTSIASFRATCEFPSEGAVLPAALPGVAWSDHWAFWQHGYPDAIMVTDTALFRYPHYHLSSDTPGRLRYDRLARVVTGLGEVLGELAGVR